MKSALELHGQIVADPRYREGDDPALDQRASMLEAIIAGARQARCPHCKTERPSTPDLPFFEYRGPGSRSAKEQCVCGYYEVAHDPAHMDTLVHDRDGKRRPTVVESGRCSGFVPRGPWDVDLFYCGCRGWD